MPNFQDVSSLGKIVPYTGLKKGDIIVNYGEFAGITSNQYGNLYNFIEVEGGEKLTLPKCGKLEHMYKEGTLKEGFRYQVKFNGRDKIQKGKWAGKEFNDLVIMLDKDYVPAGKQKLEAKPVAADNVGAGFDPDEEIPL